MVCRRTGCRLAGGAASFRYLNRSDVYTLTDVDDAEEFRYASSASFYLQQLPPTNSGALAYQGLL